MRKSYRKDLERSIALREFRKKNWYLQKLKELNNVKQRPDLLVWAWLLLPLFPYQEEILVFSSFEIKMYLIRKTWSARLNSNCDTANPRFRVSLKSSNELRSSSLYSQHPQPFLCKKCKSWQLEHQWIFYDVLHLTTIHMYFLYEAVFFFLRFARCEA